MRVAVITPYYKEPVSYLRRCIDSVRRQTHHDVEHIMVADGHPQDWLDHEVVRHLRLDRSHADFGNTPRALGGLLAASEGFDAVCFLDADNWYDPQHVDSCVEAARAQQVDFVVSLRYFVREDGSIMPLGVPEDVTGQHVDTNCFFLCRGAFHTLARWILMPRPMASLGDRFFLASLQADSLRQARTGRKTVNYLCTWASIFRALGEEPPAYAKEGIDTAPLTRWIAGLDAEARDQVSRLGGVEFGTAN